ncbi:hypothetical protein BOTBODRAFT_610126 [Botryobasidium botryosum FD-172 SS1]|uniref:N-acetyltransferase domain-containing protein n=1 Tax=Botryobasidium botryosum (strain FD-172 SS1) TaxID=930990 RepID=A0A067M6E7_BOTB1|nr:hypothetical protein BOTBODRAFT_610126 [Botryobasidium botryosum FD-172 SS1]
MPTMPKSLVRVRRLTTGDGPLLREIRLLALATDPPAFSSNAARESAYPSSVWAERAPRSAAAFIDGNPDPVGLVAYLWLEQDKHARLVSMWVKPEARRMGLGQELVGWVVDEVVGKRGAVLDLDVKKENLGAVSLYARMGFVVDIRQEVVEDLRMIYQQRNTLMVESEGK